MAKSTRMDREMDRQGAEDTVSRGGRSADKGNDMERGRRSRRSREDRMKAKDTQTGGNIQTEVSMAQIAAEFQVPQLEELGIHITIHDNTTAGVQAEVTRMGVPSSERKERARSDNSSSSAGKEFEEEVREKENERKGEKESESKRERERESRRARERERERELEKERQRQAQVQAHEKMVADQLHAEREIERAVEREREREREEERNWQRARERGREMEREAQEHEVKRLREEVERFAVLAGKEAERQKEKKRRRKEKRKDCEAVEDRSGERESKGESRCVQVARKVGMAFTQFVKWFVIISTIIYGAGGPLEGFARGVERNFTSGVENFAVVGAPYARTTQRCFMAKGPINEVLERCNGQNAILKDGGCTMDMSGDSSIFLQSTFKKCRVAIEGFIDPEKGGNKVIAVKKGDVQFVGAVNGAPVLVTIKDVLFVPEMGKKTLLSQGRFMAGGGSHASRGRVERQFDPQGKPVFDAYLEETDNLLHVEYEIARKGGRLDGPVCSYFSGITKDEAHKKLGHIGEEYLDEMFEFREGDKLSK
jgi:hypothetical protein